MDVLGTLTQDMKDALRGGNKRALEAVRYLMAQVKNFQIDKPDRSALTESEFMQIVKKVVKNTEEAIEQYEEWIVKQKDLMAALPELKDKVLGCWCKPKSCHGDVLVKLLQKL